MLVFLPALTSHPWYESHMCSGCHSVDFVRKRVEKEIDALRSARGTLEDTGGEGDAAQASAVLQCPQPFSFAGAGDLKGVNPALMYGGVVPSIVLVGPNAKKAGIPENVYSMNFMLGFDPWVKGLSSTIGVSHVDSVYSGISHAVKLPAYTLVNAGVRYETGNWAGNLQVKNLTDERYFRSNFPDLFGSSVVLPELPRTVLVSGTFKF
jgi:iron complex outermembrane receptor protein